MLAPRSWQPPRNRRVTAARRQISIRQWRRARTEAPRQSAGRGARSVGKVCRPKQHSPRDGSRPLGRSAGVHAGRGRAEVRAPPAHQIASQPIRFLPLVPDSALAALESFPLVATRCHPLKCCVIRLAPLRDQGSQVQILSPRLTCKWPDSLHDLLGRIRLFFCLRRTRLAAVAYDLKTLCASEKRLAQSQGVVGSPLKPKARNLRVFSTQRGVLARPRTTGAPFGGEIGAVGLESCGQIRVAERRSANDPHRRLAQVRSILWRRVKRSSVSPSSRARSTSARGTVKVCTERPRSRASRSKRPTWAAGRLAAPAR